MIKGDNFYYMELVSDGSQISKEEREIIYMVYLVRTVNFPKKNLRVDVVHLVVQC